MFDDCYIETTIEDVDFKIYYGYQPGVEAIIHRLPEDCEEGQPAECELSGIYLNGSQVDLIDVISDEVKEDMETYIFENHSDEGIKVDY